MKKIPLCLRLFYLFIILSLAIICYAQILENRYMRQSRFTEYNNISMLNDGWVNNAGETVKIPYKYNIEAGEDFYITRILTEDIIKEGSEMYILFRTDHTFVTAYINDTKVYSFGDKEKIPFGKTPGSGWQMIPVYNANVGDVITIVTNCPYDKYSGVTSDIMAGTKAELISYIMWNRMGAVIMTAIPFFIALFVIIILPFFFRKYHVKNFLNIGMSFAVIAVWSFTETRSWQLYFGNPYTIQIISFLTFYMVVPAMLMAVNAMGFIRNKRLYAAMMITDILLSVFLVILQLAGVADFFETLFAVHIFMVMTAVVFVASYMKGIRSERGISLLISMTLYVTIAMCAFLDLMDFYVWNKFGNGFFTRIELIIFLASTGVIASRRALSVYHENVEKRAYEKMAYTDNLTDFRNRRGFDEDVDNIAKDKKPVTILYIDMNGLKRINDNSGHYMGDRAIKAMAEQLRVFDVPDTVCYRLGGDEFCVLSYNMEPDIMEDRCIEINKILKTYGEEFGGSMGISYGIVKYTGEGDMSIYKCISEADRKMYIFKDNVYTHEEKYR